MTSYQAAGFCGHCNRAVTVRRSKGPGLMRRISSLVSGQSAEPSWECTKCGQPAGKSFVPGSAPLPAAEQTRAETRVSAPPAPELREPPPPPPSEYRDCPACRKPVRREAFKCMHCQRELQPLPRLAEATCHICSNTFAFDPLHAGRQQTCPACTGRVFLPEPIPDRAPKTTPPPVVTFADDPARPTLTLAMCAACERRLTYQKKHAGRKLACPGCGKSLVLP